MKDIIKIGSAKDESFELKRLKRVDGKESYTYIFKAPPLSTEIGIDSKNRTWLKLGKKYIIAVDSYLPEADMTVESINYIKDSKYAITFCSSIDGEEIDKILGV